MKRITTATVLGVALALSACAHQGSGSASEEGAAAAAPDTVRGVVRQVGSVPFVMTVVQGEDTAAVEGELEDEISRLAGARVTVFGQRLEGRFPGPTVRASGYEIVSVDGERPTVGILRQDAGSTFLEREGDAGPMELSSVPEGLLRHVDAKVWVITSQEGGAVLRYGLLRPADANDESG